MPEARYAWDHRRRRVARVPEELGQLEGAFWLLDRGGADDQQPACPAPGAPGAAGRSSVLLLVANPSSGSKEGQFLWPTQQLAASLGRESLGAAPEVALLFHGPDRRSGGRGLQWTFDAEGGVLTLTLGPLATAAFLQDSAGSCHVFDSKQAASLTS